jgi:hypothetical protein
MSAKAILEEQKVIERLESEGYDKVWIYDAPAGEIDEEHQHSYDTKLHILTGEIRIKFLNGGAVTDFRFKSGDEKEIPRNKIHSAKVGLGGCRYIVAERH